MLNKEISLYKLIQAEENNLQHSTLPNFKKFIKLCQSHSQIAIKFGICKHCNQTCVICPSCQPHFNLGKHEDLDLKTLANIIKGIKQKYIAYHNTFITEAIPNFLQNLTETVLSFVKELQKWDESISLIKNYIPSSNKRINDLFSNEIQDWNFRDIRCCDIFELNQIKKKVGSENSESNKARINNDLKILLNRALACKQLLPVWKKYKCQQYLKIEGDIEDVTKKLEESNQEIFKRGIKKLLVISLAQNVRILPIEQQVTSRKKQEDKLKIIEKIQLENQEEQNTKLASMVDQIYQFLKKWQSQYVKFSFKIPSTHSEFWEYFFQKLISLPEPKILSHISICCFNPERIHSIFEEVTDRQKVNKGKALEDSQQKWNKNRLAQNEQTNQKTLISCFNSFIFSFYSIQHLS